MQKWNKLGLLFDNKDYDLNSDYSAVPCCFWLTEDVMRIYYSSRNAQNKSIPYLIDYNFNLKKIINKPQLINLDLGKIGTFDDSGVMPTCILKNDNEIWMYYIGWNLGVTVPFRNAVGLAISKDDGLTFSRKFDGPILDRNKNEPHFVASNCVLFNQGIFKMWYLSCTGWSEVDGKIRHSYHIKYATSADGIDWDRNGIVAIDFNYENEYAISTPRVIIENNIYKMWYSYRGGNKSELYRIGYAESFDGIEWIRKDNAVGIDVSELGWDSDMICYPFVFDYEGERYMLYNGNNYGKTGFGLAILEK